MTIPEFDFEEDPVPAVPALRYLETTPEAVWLLQGLLGIENLAPMLLLRPYVVGEGEGPPTWHEGVSTLTEAGVLLKDGSVHPQIAEWLDVIAIPDIQINAMIRRGENHLRVAIARRDDVHVSISRCEESVVIEEMGEILSLQGLVDRLLPLCGPAPAPARLEPLTVPTSELMHAIGSIMRGHHTPAAAMRNMDLTADQQRILVEASDKPDMELSLTIIQHGQTEDYVAEAAVAVTDCSYGRIVTGPLRGGDGRWMTQVCPGTPEAITRALSQLIKTLPNPLWRQHSRIY